MPTALEEDRNVAAAFSAVAARQPERPAVRAADGSASYGDLDRLAAGVAAHLAAAEAPFDRPVLLVAEPGLRLTAAMLGVWRAGRFFVALDPVAPVGRNARIADDAAAEVMIAGTGIETAPLLRELESGGARGKAIRVHIPLEPGEWLAAVGGREASLPAPTRTERTSIAALTFTSGSTGLPKGVVQTHGAVLRNVAINRTALRVGPTDRCTLLYPPSVNPALRDLGTALLSGAEVLPHLVTREGVEALGAWIAREGLTIYSSGVTLFRQLAASLSTETRFPEVRGVRLGGEPIGRREIETFRRLFAPPARLVFGLGTTETGTVTTCAYGYDEPLPRAVVLGRPAEGVKIELLDAAGAPVPPGTVGEIAVSGTDVISAYWDGTQGRESEIAHRPAVYRTGDLARHGAEGLEYLGRADSQVKIRGLRIDFAEVERALGEVPGVAEAAVSVVDAVPRGGSDASETDDPILTAYLVAANGASLTHAGLRRELAEVLPQPMVPARFRVVERLPMTANGKLDRRALPALVSRELPAERLLTYPRDPIETRLSALWCEVLGLDLVGIDESFFDLGGDSRAAVALFSEIEKRFGTALPLSRVFSAQTVRAQAEHLREGVRRDAASPFLSLDVRRSEGRPRLFCIPAVDGYAFVYRPLAAELAGSISLTVLQFPGLDGDGDPLPTVEALADALIGRLRGAQPRGPYLLLGHSYGGLVAYEMTRRLIAAGEKVPLLVMCDSHTPDAVPFAARGVRAVESLALAARRIWRSSGGRPIAALRAIVHMARRAFKRRGGKSLVEHEIHRVRRVSTAARRRFQFGPPIEGGGTSVWLLRANPGAGSARLWNRLVARDNGWSRRLSGPLTIADVPGDHIQMLNPPNVGTLARLLVAALPRPWPEQGAERSPGRDESGEAGGAHDRAER